MTRARIGGLGAAATIGAWCLALGVSADPPRARESGAAEKAKDDKRVSLATARDRAKLLHGVYSATLDSIHHHYFRRERAVLPARAMEDVFAEVDRQSNVKSRWIAVNTPAMSINHEPETDFEKKAAAELGDGKAAYERVEKGWYHRAGAIPLGAGCVGCHTKFGATNDKTPRFSGLVISIPVVDE